MKFFAGILIAAFFVAIAFADESESESTSQSNEYLPPDTSESVTEGSTEADILVRIDGENTVDADQLGAATDASPVEARFGLKETDLDIQQNTVGAEDAASTEENEPIPAHKLKADGYHYKTPEGSRRFFF